LEGVVDFAPNNVWAVGLSGISLGNGNQVIEHFDGSKWSLFPGPKFQSTDQPALESLTAVSPRDTWAAGFILTNNGQSLFPLFEHFDGMSWKAFETFDQGAAIYGVSAVANNDVWAVGTLAFGATVIDHFQRHFLQRRLQPESRFGRRRAHRRDRAGSEQRLGGGLLRQGRKYRPPDQDPHRALGRLQLEGCLQSQHRTSLRAPIQPPRGITTVSANDVWAFGDYYAADGSGEIFTLVLHWDGINWKIVPSPSPANCNTRVDILFGETVIPQAIFGW
jgi:hypothetical protein